MTKLDKAPRPARVQIGRKNRKYVVTGITYSNSRRNGWVAMTGQMLPTNTYDSIAELKRAERKNFEGTGFWPVIFK